MPKTKPATVEEYINIKPKEVQKKLQELRSVLQKIAPKATEKIKWGTPVFEEKRILFAYSSYGTYLSFMPTRSSLEPFKNELSGYVTGKDTIQFPHDKPLPKTLIRKIALHRVKDVRENNALWMHH